MPKKFIRNLQFGVGLSLLILVASSIASYISIQNQMNNREELSKSRKAITAVKDIMIALLDSETGNRGYQLTGRDSFLEPFNLALQKTPIAIDNLKSLELEDAIQKKNIVALENNVVKTQTLLRQFVNNRKNGEPMTQIQMQDNKTHMDICREIANNFVKYEEQSVAKKNKTLNQSSTTTVLFILFSALAAILVTAYFYIKLKNDLIRRDKLEKELTAKDIEISKRVNAIKEIANRVAKGNYELTAIDNNKDDLGELVFSLNNMTQSLKTSFDKINSSDWKQKGLATLNESLVGNKSVKQVNQDALNHLIDYGNCLGGAIYLQDDGKLKLEASYGLEDQIKKIYLPGEGMIGKSFVQNETHIYNDLNEDDFSVSFASSKIKIKSITVIPITIGKNILGIIELASKENLDQKALDFYNEANRILAIAINAAKSREKEQRLLEETQAQAEELQVQHSELENLNTELEVQTQKLQASEEELKVQQEELMQANAELEERSKSLEEKNHLIGERNLEIQKKAEELALSTKYKSEFLANMSHELRTPLNSILLLSRLMAENPDENLNEDQIESAKVIQSSGTSLLTLIDEILDLAKIESGKMTLEYKTIAIEEITKDLRNLFEPVAREKRLNFIINVDTNDVQSLEIDRLRLDQILRNLISNAIKFTSEGNIELSIYSQNSEFIFKVKDSGIGIPEEKQAVIFEAFQQADGSTRRKFGGTGLGLSISREIAKLLGGKINVESKVGEGSTFTLSIPKDPNAKKEIIETDQNLVNTIQQDLEEINHLIEDDKKEITKNNLPSIPEDVSDDRNDISENDKVILIIEDDTNFAKALIKYAHINHYKAIVVVRGDYALDAALQYNPRAILLDIQLPVKDGWQVMDELKSNSSTRHIPVHMMSALQAKPKGMMKGAIDFINKPIALEQMSQVFQTIENALSKSHQRKVLIVEENNKHANALSYFLGNFNIPLSLAENVEDCISELTNDKVECVILDIGDSKGNEFQIVEKIKSHNGLENLPIIIFTERHLSKSEEMKIKEYADSIVIKTAHSYQRILDEVGLFLHLVEDKNNENLPSNKTLGSLTEVLSGKKILITDDDARNIFSLTKALEQYKVEVIVAMDGKQAMEQVKQNIDIDVVLMDMMMPEMDGYETIKEMRKIPRLKKLPILAVTAKSMIGDRNKCIEAGASDYISKPVDLDQLLSLLRVWLYEN